ncbi:unnamed protein product [Urochloa humidicola]
MPLPCPPGALLHRRRPMLLRSPPPSHVDPLYATASWSAKRGALVAWAAWLPRASAWSSPGPRLAGGARSSGTAARADGGRLNPYRGLLPDGHIPSRRSPRWPASATRVLGGYDAVLLREIDCFRGDLN